MKSPFITWADFEGTLEPEDNGKQNSEESYTNLLLAVMAIN